MQLVFQPNYYAGNLNNILRLLFLRLIAFGNLKLCLFQFCLKFFLTFLISVHFSWEIKTIIGSFCLSLTSIWPLVNVTFNLDLCWVWNQTITACSLFAIPMHAYDEVTKQIEYRINVMRFQYLVCHCMLVAWHSIVKLKSGLSTHWSFGIMSFYGVFLLKKFQLSPGFPIVTL